MPRIWFQLDPYSVNEPHDSIQCTNRLGVSRVRIQDSLHRIDKAERAMREKLEAEAPTTGTPIKTGTYAVLDTNLLTGVSAIELRGGAQDESDLVEGQTIRWEHSALGAVGESLPAAVGGVEEVLARLSALLDAENRERIARLLDSSH